MKTGFYGFHIFAIIAAALAMASLACDDARTTPTPAPIAAAPTAVPT